MAETIIPEEPFILLRIFHTKTPPLQVVLIVVIIRRMNGAIDYFNVPLLSLMILHEY